MTGLRYRGEIRTAACWIDQYDEVLVLRYVGDGARTPRYSVIAPERSDPYPGLRIEARWVRVDAIEFHRYMRLLLLADGSRIAATDQTQITFRRPY